MTKTKKLVVGLDEVGMGALAGPLVVVAAGFFGSRPIELENVTDSKKMTKLKREMYAPRIVELADYVGFGLADAGEIDELGMSACWNKACMMALEMITYPVYELIIDGNREVALHRGPQRTVVKGDQKIWQISCASVVAKVLRDQDMDYYDEAYPRYNFSSNSGYGSAYHMEMIREHGPTVLHRQLFLRKMNSQGSSPEDEGKTDQP